MGQRRRVKVRFYWDDMFWVGVICFAIGFCLAWVLGAFA